VGALILTVVQALVVGSLGRVPVPKTRPPTAPIHASLVWDPSLVADLVSGIPRSRLDVFERDPGDPFQRIAISTLPPPQYRSAEWREPTRWLTNPVAWSGIRPNPVLPTIRSTDSTDSTRPRFPESGVRSLAPTNTVTEVIGDLALRAWNTPPVTRPWPGTELLGTTRLHVAVNPQGWIVLIEVAESCGSGEADDLARQTIRQALFKPLNPSSPRPEFETSILEWGTVLVHWSTQPTVR
jgi:hypothetical protein